MNFCKAEGTGNDFIIINNIEEKIPEEKLGLLAKHLCRRRFSIGADGLMAIAPPTVKGCDFRMLFFNADGSMGEMCGNGARCICRYGYEHGLTQGRTHVNVETTAGVITGERISKDTYRILMNNPSIIETGVVIDDINEDLCEVLNKHSYLVNTNLEITCDYIELGNPGLPHVVVHFPGIEHISDDEVRPLCRFLRHHPRFPKGANVNLYDFAECSNTTAEGAPEGHRQAMLYLKTFERGVEDFTYACGTGSVSTAISVFNKKIFKENSYVIRQAGGALSVSMITDKNNVKAIYSDCNPGLEIYLEGPAQIVYKGSQTLEFQHFKDLMRLTF